MGIREEFVAAVRARLAEKGVSLRAAAKSMSIPLRSFYGVINDGQDPSLTRAEYICHALGLEFYIGPPRGNDKSVAVQTSKAKALEQLNLHELKAAREILARIETRLEHAAAPGLDDPGAVGDEGSDTRPVET